MLLHSTPEERGNPEITSLHLNAACNFANKHKKTHKNITWSQLNHPALSKQLTVCTRQDLGREQRILQNVTVTLDVYQFCHSISPCVKNGSCSSSSWTESQWTVLLRYLINLLLSQQMLYATNLLNT